MGWDRRCTKCGCSGFRYDDVKVEWECKNDECKYRKPIQRGEEDKTVCWLCQEYIDKRYKPHPFEVREEERIVTCHRKCVEYWKLFNRAGDRRVYQGTSEARPKPERVREMAEMVGKWVSSVV